MLVVDTYLIDFENAIEEIGTLKSVTDSDKAEHKRYIIRVGNKIVIEDAARVISRALSQIAKEIVDMGEMWDLWREKPES
jgi:hypothetical protein